MRTITIAGGLMMALSISLAPGCKSPANELTILEPAAGPDEPALAATAAPPPDPAQSVVVFDGPPQELSFSSSLTNRQRDLIDSEFDDEIAGARGPARPTVAEFDLNADGTTELFVIIKAEAWCGSGDVCNVWVYQQAGDGWQALSDGEDAASCVSILPTATNGYRDVRIHGLCAVNMCTFDLRFDGSLYQWDGNRDCTPAFE